MSLEQAIQENNALLRESIAATKLLVSSMGGTQGELTQANLQPSGDSTTTDSESETAGKKAMKKTYIFFKGDQTGVIVTKGETIPEANGATAVGKAKWEELCEKYSLDVTTGEKVVEAAGDLELDLDEEPEAESNELDLDEEPETTVDDDDDLDLDLDDDDDGVKIEDVQVALRNVGSVEKLGREVSLKILKKFGATNLTNLDVKHYEDVIRVAEKQIAKATA